VEPARKKLLGRLKNSQLSIKCFLARMKSLFTDDFHLPKGLNCLIF
jgi:hypothetical protein